MPSNGERSSTNGNSIGTSVTLWFPNIFKIIGVMTAAATSILSRECFSAAALSAATKRSPARTKNSGQGIDGRVTFQYCRRPRFVTYYCSQIFFNS